MSLVLVPALITLAVWGLAWAARGAGAGRPRDPVDLIVCLIASSCTASTWATAAGVWILT